MYTKISAGLLGATAICFAAAMPAHAASEPLNVEITVGEIIEVTVINGLGAGTATSTAGIDTTTTGAYGEFEVASNVPYDLRMTVDGTGGNGTFTTSPTSPNYVKFADGSGNFMGGSLFIDPPAAGSAWGWNGGVCATVYVPCAGSDGIAAGTETYHVGGQFLPGIAGDGTNGYVAGLIAPPGNYSTIATITASAAATSQ